jgi:hypothetical protein
MLRVAQDLKVAKPGMVRHLLSMMFVMLLFLSFMLIKLVL